MALAFETTGRRMHAPAEHVQPAPVPVWEPPVRRVQPLMKILATSFRLANDRAFGLGAEPSSPPPPPRLTRPPRPT